MDLVQERTPDANSLSPTPPTCIDLTLLTMRKSGHMSILQHRTLSLLPCSWRRRSYLLGSRRLISCLTSKMPFREQTRKVDQFWQEVCENFGRKFWMPHHTTDPVLQVRGRPPRGSVRPSGIRLRPGLRRETTRRKDETCQNVFLSPANIPHSLHKLSLLPALLLSHHP